MTRVETSMAGLPQFITTIDGEPQPFVDEVRAAFRSLRQSTHLGMSGSGFNSDEGR